MILKYDFESEMYRNDLTDQDNSKGATELGSDE